MKKPWHIYDKTYMQNYYISYGVSKEDFVKQVKKYADYSENIDDLKGGKALVYTIKKNNVVWIWTEKKDLSCLVHELSHAVWYCFDMHGIKHTDDTDENYAYLLAMLLRDILKGKKKGDT